MKIIHTGNLKSWADSASSNGELPELVKNLVRATAIEIRSIRFPHGDAVNMPGYDGILVVNKSANDYVPEGLSVWEMGTGERPSDKANKDYIKRTKQVTQDRRETITFVFVTPRRWNNRNEWIEEKKAEGKWKDVRAIDGVDLQDWLEQAPVIALTFAQAFGLVPNTGVSLITYEWDSIKYRSNPNIVESLVTAGREKACEALIEHLTGLPHSIVVQGDSPQEAIAFSIATLLQIEDEELRKEILSRTLVVSDENAARGLSICKLPLVLIMSNEQINSYALPAYGHHVIKPVGTDALNLNNPIKLPRPDSDVFSKELEKMGMEQDQAKKIAKICARSVTIFQRLKPSEQAVRPEWASADKLVNLIPAMLAGRWDGSNENDRNILCKLFECDTYDQVEEKINYFITVNEAPLQKAGSVWSLTAPADSFSLIARHISTKQFGIFKKVFSEVLGEIDPIISLTPDERMYASIKNAKLKYSDWIRRGLSETLLIISQVGPSIDKIQCPTEPQIFANEVIRSLPNLDNWDLIASLRDQYSILMEASPDPLLEALEKALEGNPNGFKKLTEEAREFGGYSLHTGILWALETLAWDPKYLKRVSLLLAKLSLNDPGGRIVNRPINSLSEIFLSWHPGTNANLEQRIDALEFVIKNVDDIAWPLIDNLLPNPGSSFTTGTSQPNWREAGRDKRENLTYAIVWESEEYIISRALDLAGTKPERWNRILQSITRIPKKLLNIVLEKLDSIDPENLDEDIKTELWSVLRDFVNSHLSHQDARWSLKPEILKPFEKIIQNLEPRDLIKKNLWLFNDYYPELPNIISSNYELTKNETEKLRKEAVNEIIQIMGNDGIIKLAKNAKFKDLVGTTCISHYENKEEVFSLIVDAIKDDNDLLDFVSNLSAGASTKFSSDWKDFVLGQIKEKKDWSPVIRSSILLFWPNNFSTWESVDNTDEETAFEYWRRVNFFRFEGTPRDANIPIENLIKVDRAKDVFDAIAFIDEGISSDMIMKVANSVIERLYSADSGEDFKAHCPAYAREFIRLLQGRDDISEDDKVRIEYSLLPLLGYRPNVDLVLYDKLSRDPVLFTNLVCDVFKASSEEPTSEPTAQQRIRAQYGFRLLETWHKVPGQKADGSLDPKIIMEWVEEARKLCLEADRADIGDEYIGKVLAHAKCDPVDGAWPDNVVREVIEHFKSEKLEVGIRIERFNMRGTYTKALYEGGDQERELARQYRQWADTCTSWPRTNRLLLKISEEWEFEAKKEDEEANKNKIRHS